MRAFRFMVNFTGIFLLSPIWVIPYFIYVSLTDNSNASRFTDELMDSFFWEA